LPPLFAFRIIRMQTMRLLAAIMVTLASAAGAYAASPEAPAGALSCSGCHAASVSVQTPVPRLEGRKAADIVEQMQAFRDDKRDATVMGRIAKGFSDPEIRAIATWYAGLR
jgi:sulfide dehydrogenase cytochrome subunit